jgi:hypothetical protein
MVNILGTPCYNTVLVYILIIHINFQLVLKQAKLGVFVLFSPLNAGLLL